MKDIYSAKSLLQPDRPLNWPDDLTKGKLPQSFLDICRYVFELDRPDATSDPRLDLESYEYGALQFALNGKQAIFRQAKTTPKKLGQFVTLWKRASPERAIAPYDSDDEIAWFVIAAFSENQHGVFIFDVDTLAKRGIVTINGREGKRAMRLYAPWTQPLSKQAVRTQSWQIEHFIQLDGGYT